jgi:predicted nucleic acid-binding protein
MDALSDYLGLPLTKHGHSALVPRIFALRDNFTAADATYVALAESLGATLVTCDSGQTRAAQDHSSINVIGVAT